MYIEKDSRFLFHLYYFSVLSFTHKVSERGKVKDKEMWTFPEFQETCVNRAAAGSSLWLGSPIFPARLEPWGKRNTKMRGRACQPSLRPKKERQTDKMAADPFSDSEDSLPDPDLCPQKSGATPIFSAAYISSILMQQHIINTSRLQRPQWESNREAYHARWIKIVALKTQPVSAIYIISQLKSLENKCWECSRNSKKFGTVSQWVKNSDIRNKKP